MRSKGNSSAPARLTRWEIVGAWLHVWTAPKGLEVPPVPWRKVALYGLGAAALIGVALALIVPPLNDAKRKGEATRAREAAAVLAAERARLSADQRVHTVRVTSAHGSPVEKTLVAALERAITADARGRARRGTINGPVLGTACEGGGKALVVFPQSRVYKCFVTTAAGLRGQGTDVLGAGFPFVATVYTKIGRVACARRTRSPTRRVAACSA
jgi:hypothetical protein